jgi:hypothetical protein
MPDYRLYFLDEHRHVRRRLDMECRDDAHAVAVVTEHLDEPMELWSGARLVRAFERDVRAVDRASPAARPPSIGAAGPTGPAAGSASSDGRS